jgi:hypothetical protein
MNELDPPHFRAEIKSKTNFEKKIQVLAALAATFVYFLKVRAQRARRGARSALLARAQRARRGARSAPEVRF